jgi:hypothetical protein
MVVPSQPGPVGVPGQGAHTTWTPVDQRAARGVTPNVFWHVHPRGTSTQQFVQGPSTQDQAVARAMNTERPITSVVLGAGNHKVYIYDGSSNVQTVSFKDFFRR